MGHPSLEVKVKNKFKIRFKIKFRAKPNRGHPAQALAAQMPAALMHGCLQKN